jgi:hypothetical protein
MLAVIPLACIYAVLGAVRQHDPVPAPPAEPASIREPAPWWLWVISFVVALPLFVLSIYVTKYVLEAIEYVAFAWRRCPNCKARRWSWGFTEGFGL